MAGNTLGTLFRITTYGESHGIGIGVIIDGCPAGIRLSEDFINDELARRRPGQSAIVTQRRESDNAIIQSGVFDGITTGAPIHLFIPNEDHRSKDYDHLKDKYRPSHADYTYEAKYGSRDHRGGGRSSARETAARVAAGAVAKIILAKLGVEIKAFVSQVGSIALPDLYPTHLDAHAIETNPVRCPDKAIAVEMEDLIRKVRKEGDTIGGRISCIIKGCPAGWGEPVFDKLHADLGKAMLSINAVKGFEYGSGFECIQMLGSEHNDVFQKIEGRIATATNHSGGIQGGISNGMDINFNVAFKPVATLIQSQDTIDKNGEETTIDGTGRHDPCVVPRAVPIVEAMAALVLADHYFRQRAIAHLFE